MKALITIILDRSGSMAGLETDVVGGVNKFIEEQKAVPGEAVLSLVRFDTVYEEFRHAKPLSDVEPLKNDEFVPRGGTALLDAIGRTLGAMNDAWSKHHPDKAICVIVTDGQENSSREFRQDKIKEMIESREKSEKWSFIYLGADVTTFADAAALGIQGYNTAQYSNTSAGTQAMYASASIGVAQLRSGAKSAGLGGVIPEAQPSPSKSTAQAMWTAPKSAHTWTPPT